MGQHAIFMFDCVIMIHQDARGFWKKNPDIEPNIGSTRLWIVVPTFNVHVNKTSGLCVGMFRNKVPTTCPYDNETIYWYVSE